MPFLYADRVRETSTSTGTGTFALAGAVSNFRTFSSAIGASNTTYYAIVHRTAAEWEVGYGTLDALGTTLTRTTVLYSSTGSAVSFTAGTKDVFVTIPSVALSSISTPNSTGSALQALTLSPFGTLAGNTAEIRFLELAANGTNYIGFKAPDSLAGNQIWTLPTADGTSGQFFQTNGSGVTTWATVTSVGTVTTGTWNASTIGIPYGGTGQTTASAAFNALSPITTLGDVIYGSGTNTSTRLAGNTTTTKQFLSQTGTGTVSAVPAWSTVSKSDVGLGSVENTALSTWAGSTNITTLGTIGTGTWNATTIGTTKGGTGLTAIGTANQILGVNSGATALQYKTLTQGSNVTITHGVGTVTIAATGTVTSVGLSLPSIFTVSNSPVTSSGTLTGTLATQAANLVFSGPTTGVDATPTFRSLVAADLPTITSLGTVATGTWNASIIDLAYGGTNANLTAVDGAVAYSTGSALALTAAGNANQVLISNGASAPTWSSGLILNDQQALLINPYGVSFGNTSELRFAGLAFYGAQYVGFKAPDIISSSITWTLPNADGANGQFLTTNGTGSLSWSYGINTGFVSGGRLTGLSGAPNSGDGTYSTLYFTPYINDVVYIYDSTSATFVPRIFSEQSIVGTTLTASTIYDIFAYWTGSAVAITSVAWSGASSRAIGNFPTYLNGVLVHPSTYYTYIGTVRTDASQNFPDTTAARFIWNQYNRIQRNLFKNDTGVTSYTYNTATVRKVRGQASNMIEIVSGDYQGITVSVSHSWSNTSAATSFTGIGGNSSTTFDIYSYLSGTAGVFVTGSVTKTYTPPVGYYFYAWLEQGNATGTNTFYIGSQRGGITGIWQC